MGTNRTGIGIGIGIPFKNNALGQGRIISPDLLASLKAVVICDGKSNTDSDRAVLRNLVDKDNPFVASNFAWKLDSGYGGYNYDYTDNNFNSDKTLADKVDDKTVNYFATKNSVGFFKQTDAIYKGKIRITGVESAIANGEIEYFKIYSNSLTGNEQILIYKDGVYDIDIKGAEDASRVFFFALTSNPNVVQLTTPIIIKQLPSHDGALVFDGVNDRVISTKTMQEMVGDTNAVTVVSMIHQISLHSTNTRNNYIRPNTGNGYLFNNVGVVGKTGIYGYKGNINSITNNSTISAILGDKADYSTGYAAFNTIMPEFSVNGVMLNNSFIHQSSIAWYWTIIANKVLTTDEIHQVITYYNLDKHVKPDIYYDVKKQGLTNANHAQFNDKLIDYSGNGHDMQLYNIGWNETSGVNADGSLVLDGVNDYGKVTGVPIVKDYTVISEYERIQQVTAGTSILSKSIESNKGAFMFNADGNNYATSNNMFTYSFGKNSGVSMKDDSLKFYYQTKYFNQGKAITVGTAADTDTMWLGTVRDNDNRFANIAINSLMVFPYSLDEFLIERQLKRHKVGTLHPDLIELRPIVKSDGKLDEINYFLNTYSTKLYPGDYIPKGSTILVNLISTSEVDEFKSLKVNGKEVKFNQSIGSTNRAYISATATYNKAPLKIEVSLDNYIRFENIQQPYPFVFSLVNAETDEEYAWGDKIKYGTKLQIIKKSNLLVGVYKQTIDTMFTWNGNVIAQDALMSKEFVVGKDKLVFGVQGLACEFTNEPNIIAAPQKLRLPNISYKRLGYIPDISGHGNNIKLYNSGYSGMSGANGYGTDFTVWNINSASQGKYRTLTEDFVEYEVLGTSNALMYRRIASANETFVLYADVDTYMAYSNETEHLIDIPAGKPTKVVAPKTGTLLLWTKSKPMIGDIITIQQVGLYDGAFCFDGVNDYGQIPTLTQGGKQVFMKVNRMNKDAGILYDQRKTTDAFTFALSGAEDTLAYEYRNTDGTTYIDAVENNHILTGDIKDITHNITALNSNVTVDNSTIPTVGSSTGATYFSMFAMYSFVLFPEISDESEIIRFNEIMGIEGKYVERPMRYFDAYGKTNQDTDKDTIVDQVTKLPANALSLKNIAYEGMSGYNGYPVSLAARNSVDTTFSLHTNIDGGTFTDHLSTLVTIPIGEGYIYTYVKNNTLTEFNKEIPLFRVKITGIDSTKFNLRYYYLASASAVAPSNYLISSDGTHTLPKSFASDGSLTSQQVWIGFGFVGVGGTTGTVPDVNFSIEVLPDYENGLVLDGVNDGLENTILPALTDFTFITKRKNLLSTYPNNAVYIQKGLDNANRKWALLGEYWYNSKCLNYVFNRASYEITLFELLGFITPTNYNGTALKFSEGEVYEDSQGLCIGKRWKGVFYKLMIFDKSIDMLSINMIKNLMNKDGIVDLDNPVFKE